MVVDVVSDADAAAVAAKAEAPEDLRLVDLDALDTDADPVVEKVALGVVVGRKEVRATPVPDMAADTNTVNLVAAEEMTEAENLPVQIAHAIIIGDLLDGERRGMRRSSANTV